MPSFRQHPLTWLFFIALACLNVVALAGDFQADWYSDLIVAQVFIAAGWLALGSAHRLARAGVFVAVIVGSVVPDYLMDSTLVSVWRYMLGSLIALAAVTTASCWFWLIIARLIRRDSVPLAGVWRFSVAEILGWMILVAVGSVIVPTAVFRHLNQPDSDWMVLSVASVVAGLLMTLLVRRTPLGDAASIAVAMVAVTAAVVYLSRLDPYKYMSLVRAYAVVGVWILVQRLDDRMGTSESLPVASTSKPLRVYAPESDDQHRRLG